MKLAVTRDCTDRQHQQAPKKRIDKFKNSEAVCGPFNLP